MRALTVLAMAVLIAGCGQEMAMTSDSQAGPYPEARAPIVDPVGIRPIPPIPALLHGCWAPIAVDDPDEPNGSSRLFVGATTITQEAGGGEPRRVATADFVSHVTRTQIEGRWSYRTDGGGTLATSLSTGPDNVGTPPGTLRRAEGDAGSVQYRRCRP